MTAENETEPSSKDYSMLPPDAYELIGKAVGERLEVICSEYRVEIAGFKTAIAEYRADIAELKSYRDEVVREMRQDILNRVTDFTGVAAGEIAKAISQLEEKMATVKDGENGKDGLQGEKGEPGPRGETGERGESGEAGKDGAPGEPGIDGAPGERGEKGDPGEAGKDGVITTKVAAYKDVWKEGEVYGLGDFVTLGGSLWHCNAPTWTNEKPGTTETWTLAVKRGRDGKDGKDGTPGAKGDKGAVGYYKGILQDDAGKS
jgi:hypothetical protein